MTDQLAKIEALHKAVAKSDEGEPWVAHYDADADRWGIGPDYEMGHRAELDGWCRDEAELLVTARNALPDLLAVAKAARDYAEALELLNSAVWTDHPKWAASSRETGVASEAIVTLRTTLANLGGAT